MPDTLKEEQAVLRLDNVSKNFGGVVAASDICIQLFRGEVFGLIGPNGAGKTTLFNCLNRDLKTDGGDFFLQENGERVELAAEDIGYVLSTPTVPEFLTGREFLKFFIDINEKSIAVYKSFG